MKKLVLSLSFIFLMPVFVFAMTNTPAGQILETRIFVSASNAVSTTSNVDTSTVVKSNFGGTFITVATDQSDAPLNTVLKFTNTIKNMGNHDETYKLCLLATNLSGAITKWNAHLENLAGGSITTLGPISRFSSSQFVLAVSVSNGSSPDSIGFKIGAQAQQGNNTTSTAYVGDNGIDYAGDIGVYASPGIVVYNTNGGTPSQDDGYITLFIGDTTPPSIPVLVSPASNSVGNNATITFSWNASTDNVGVDHYVIEVDDTSSAFGSIESTASPSGTSQAFTLTDGVKYWRVRAYDKAGNAGNWSASWTVNIDATAPTAPVLSLPTDTTITNDNTPLLVWNSVADAASYEISIDGGVAISVGGTNYTPGALTEGAHT